MNENILELRNISKSFGETKALNNVDFYLRKGTIHGLLGENGAGKTSLMNIILVFTNQIAELSIYIVEK